VNERWRCQRNNQPAKRDYHSGSKGNGNGNSDHDSCGNSNGNCDGNRKCRAANGDNVGGGCRPGGFDKQGALVLATEAAAKLIVDNAKVVTSALPLFDLPIGSESYP
jgi:hypothetical protein